MLSFDDFVKVFDAYSKYVSQVPPAPQTQQVPPAQQAPKAQQAPQTQQVPLAQQAPKAQQAPQTQQVPPAPQAQQAPKAQQAPQAQDSITQMLTQMQSLLNQMQTPAPSTDKVKPLSVDDVIAKIFD